MNCFFFLPKLTFQCHLHKIYMTYFNEVIVSRNILMNSQLRTNTDESDFSENEIQDLNSLKPFEFEPKTNIRNISSSQKQPSEVYCNKSYSYKFRKIHRKTLDLSHTGLSHTTLLKKRLWHRCFPVIFAKFLRT